MGKTARETYSQSIIRSMRAYVECSPNQSRNYTLSTFPLSEILKIPCRKVLAVCASEFYQRNAVQLYQPTLRRWLSLKSIPSRLAQFYYIRGLWRPHTRTCIIMQETVSRVLCPLIVFLKVEHIY